MEKEVLAYAPTREAENKSQKTVMLPTGAEAEGLRVPGNNHGKACENIYPRDGCMLVAMGNVKVIFCLMLSKARNRS